MFSTSSRDIVVNTLHCRIPLVSIPVGVWVNLSIDVLSFVSECFKSQTFRSIDYFSISANCKIRRIFSMRNSLTEWDRTNNEEFPMEYGEILPKNLALPSGLTHENINLNIERVRGSPVEEGVTATYSEGLNRNFNSNPNNNGEKRNPRENDAVNFPVAVTGTYTGVKKSSNQRIPRNSNSPQKKIDEIRSKSQNRPVKIPKQSNKMKNLHDDRQDELLNKQEFIKNNIKFCSKSPDGPSDEENSLEGETNRPNVFNKYSSNQSIKIEAIKNKIKNIVNNKNIIQNMKKYDKATKEITSPKNIPIKSNRHNKNRNGVNNIKFPVNESNKINLYNEGKVSKMLLNTLNYKNVEKWEISKDNMADSIEEIFEVEDRNNWVSESNRNLEERQ